MKLLNTILGLGLAGALTIAGAASATTLTSKLNVDNAFEVSISTNDGMQGAIFGSGGSWPTTFMQTSGLLTPGVTNYLHIRAWDVGPPASLLGAFTLSDANFAFGNGTQSLLSGSSHLVVSKTGWGAYGPTTDLGANGIGPWGFMPNNDPSARWVWSDNRAGNDTVYFSAVIRPLTPPAVPLPAGAVLLVSALGGLVLRARMG